MLKDKKIQCFINFLNEVKKSPSVGNKGSEFEEKIQDILRKNNFDRKTLDEEKSSFYLGEEFPYLPLKKFREIKKEIKDRVLDKTSVELIKNPLRGGVFYLSTFWVSKFSWFFNFHWCLINTIGS